jgi:hypothetical protein
MSAYETAPLQLGESCSTLRMCEPIGARRGHRKKGSASEQGLGRSRGGFSTKMVLTAVDENTPAAVEVLPGQVHEATQVEKMLDATQARLPQIEEAVADKEFDGEPQREAMVALARIVGRPVRSLTVSLSGKRCCEFACASGSLSPFDGEPQQQALKSRNIRPVIPYRVNRPKQGRLNWQAYAERNKIERPIGTLKVGQSFPSLRLSWGVTR